jgi:hypothetical protein
MYSIASCPNYEWKNAGSVFNQSENLHEILELLTENKCYHSVLSSNVDKRYIMFFDLDGNEDHKVDVNEFIQKMCSYINDIYKFKLNINDFCYTKNDKYKYKFHVTIPIIEAKCSEQKALCREFVKKYPQYEKYKIADKYYEILDTSVYRTNGLFRLPNQTKGIKDDEDYGLHIIMRGKMEDFILDNTVNSEYLISNTSITSNIAKEDTNTNNNNNEKSYCDNIKERIISYINLLPSNYYDVYNDWIHVLMVLYNELEYQDCLTIACDFSKKSDKYNSEEQIKDKLSSFKYNIDNSLKIGSLIKWVRDSRNEIVKEDNKMTMYEIEKYLCNKEYNNYDEAINDIINKMGDSICIFNYGTKRYIAVYTFYNEEHDTKIMDVGKYLPFADNYKHIKIKYEAKIMDKNGKSRSVLIDKKLTSIIESEISFLYEKYYIKPYHPFENNENTDKRFKNLFSPMIAKYLKNYDITKINPILIHIKKVLANNNEYHYKWIMSWLHQIIRTPWKKTDKCIVLNGKQGTGKSLLFDFMKKHIFGDITAYYAAGMGALIDRFNWWGLSNIFIICDEPTKLNELNLSTYEEKLKTIITAPTKELEKKGGDKIQGANFSNLIITSNHTKGIVVREDCRRYAIFKVSNKYINNEFYFNNLTDCLDNKEYMNIFFSYLYDYDDTVNIKEIPETDIRKSCKEESRTQLEQFLFDSEFCAKFRKNELLTSDILYNKYENWYRSINYNEKFKKNKIGFCREMNKTYGESKQKKINGKNLTVFCFNDDIIDRITFIDDFIENTDIVKDLDC